MTVSYPLSWPSSPAPRDATIRQVSKVATTESAFTFSTQKQRHAGQRWEIDITLPPMTDTTARSWTSFILSLNGTEGTVLIPHPDRQTATGIATGTPLTNGSHAAGVNSLVTDGWTISTTNILKAGDVIQIGSYMYEVLNSVNSDGSGNATLDIWPRVRSTIANNTTITVSNPKTLMRLASNDNSWATNSLKHHEITLTFIEELPSS